MEDTNIIITQNSHTDSQLETVECYQIIEEDSQLETVECYQIIEEVSEIQTKETPQVVEEGPSLCPLCSSEIKYFHVNFTEKLLMCANGECEFPFGYEELQFKTFEQTDDCDMTITQKFGSQYSNTSNSSAAQVGKVNTNNVDNKNNHQFLVPKTVKRESPKEKMLKRKKTEIKKNLKYLEESNMQLHLMEKRKSIIWNPKWIDNLKHIQDMSGVELLQPRELKNVPVQKNNEMRLDIEKGDGNNLCSIKILMAPPSTSNANA